MFGRKAVDAILSSHPLEVMRVCRPFLLRTASGGIAAGFHERLTWTGPDRAHFTLEYWAQSRTVRAHDIPTLCVLRTRLTRVWRGQKWETYLLRRPEQRSEQPGLPQTAGLPFSLCANEPAPHPLAAEIGGSPTQTQSAVMARTYFA